MIKLVYYSGLTNGTFFAVSVLLLVAIVAALRNRSGDRRDAVIEATASLARSPIFVVLLGLATLANVSFGIYKGYVVPRDVMQDVFSARSLMNGGSLYPSGMTPSFIREMEEHPPRFSIWAVGSDGRRDEAEARAEAAASDWVQAHPPAMTLFFVPIVIVFGNIGSYLAISVLSLVSLLAALVLIARTLGFTLGRVASTTVGLAVLGWSPTIDVWRNGQSGLYLLLLIVAAWIWLRDRRPLLAGVAIGIATCLKLYPGILLVYFVVRHRTAFVSAVVTIGCVFVATWLLCGPEVYLEFAKTADFVTNLYADYTANVSLLGLLVGVFHEPGALASLRVVTAVLSFAIALAAALPSREEWPENRHGKRVARPRVRALPFVRAADGADRVGTLPGHPDPPAGRSGEPRLRNARTAVRAAHVSALARNPRRPVHVLLCAWGVGRSFCRRSRDGAASGEDANLLDDLAQRMASRAMAIQSGAVDDRPGERLMRRRLVISLAIIVAHAALYRPSEPFYDNDETRNVMTGVFFHDALIDLPVSSPVRYAVDYYLQYPALGILHWPPFFHASLGAFMLAFGTTLLTARILIVVFALIACNYLYAIVERTHDAVTASLAMALLGLSPLMFEMSHYVMLEVPTLASSVAALFYFLRYLDSGRRADLYLASVASSLALLTRFDGAYLVPTFLILCIARGRLDLLKRVEFFIAVAIAVVLTLPTYAVMFKMLGSVHTQVVVSGTYPEATRPFHPLNFVSYLVWLPRQMGWFALAPAVIGFVASLRVRDRSAAWPYFAVLLSVYAMIVSVAEIEPRHAIYWSPALALFAAHGLSFVGKPKVFAALTIVVVAGTFWSTTRKGVFYLNGYEDAARYVVDHTTRSRFCLFDHSLNGDFIFQVRRHDPARRLWILRGDKLFYSTLIDPQMGYREFASGEADILKGIAEYDPEFLVLEEPSIGVRLPMAEALRSAVHAHPDRFALEARFPIASNLGPYQGKALNVYRVKPTGAEPKMTVKLYMLSLGRSLETVVAPKD